MGGVKFKNLPNKVKNGIIPPVGSTANIGEFVFRVTHRNVGKLRFTLTLMGRRKESRILKPGDLPPGDRKIIVHG